MTHIIFKPDRRVQVVIVEDISLRAIPRQHPNSTRRINKPMVRTIDDRATPLNQQLIILINKRPPHIPRPANPNTILHPPLRKPLVKATALPMTKPDIVPAIAVTHPRPLLRPDTLVRDEGQLHRIWALRFLDRQQIIRQRNLPDIVPETAEVQVRLARGLVGDERCIDGVGDVERPHIRIRPLPGPNQRPVVRPRRPVQGRRRRNPNSTLPRAMRAHRVKAVKSAILLNSRRRPRPRPIPHMNNSVAVKNSPNLRPGPADILRLEKGQMMPALEEVVAAVVPEDIRVVNLEVAVVWERELVGCVIDLRQSGAPWRGLDWRCPH